ncbi:MAG: hypothetical protein RSA20_10355 [Oscillospiraceae bacterium]
MDEMVRVCFDFRMTMGQGDVAENCVKTSITKKAYEQIAQGIKCNCWTNSMACDAGEQVTAMLKMLATLQGCKCLVSWDITLEDSEV